MQSNMEKTAAWAKLAEEAKDPIERQANASVAQVYASMVIADRLAKAMELGGKASGIDILNGPPVNYWGDGS